jgi:hypothetical protein
VNLRDLDDRYVPALARFVQRATAPLDRFRRARPPAPVTRPRPQARPVGPAPVIVRLRGVDDRYARSGPLALLRDLPQLGYLAIGAIVLAGGATALQRSRNVDARDAGDQVVDTAPGGGDDLPDLEEGDARVGPALGDDVVSYLGDAQAELRRRADRDDDDDHSWAVVSFVRYLDPTQLAATVKRTPPSFILFRVPPRPGTQAEPEAPAPVKGDVTQATVSAFARVARDKRVEAAEKERLVTETANDPAFQKEYADLAAQYKREATALSGGCACVFAVIVKASADDLLRLSRVAGVRTVDIGPRNAEFKDLQFRGLLPEEKVTVTGGNEGNAGGNG